MPMRGKPAVYLQDKSDGLLECLLCLNHLRSSIQQLPVACKLCSNCNSRVNCKCPSCRKFMSSVRQPVVDKVPFSLPRIPNHLDHMNVLPYYNKLKCRSNCVARPYNCPYPGFRCPVRGDIYTLVTHLRQIHRVDLQRCSSFSQHYMRIHPSIEDSSLALTLFNCFDAYFCLHFEVFQLGTEPVYMAFLSFLGEASDAGKFNYELQVGGNRRKLAWQGIPRSIRQSHQKVRDSLDGLIVLRNMVLYFCSREGKDLKLTITGRIWKEE